MFDNSGKIIGRGKVGEAGCTGPTENRKIGDSCGRQFGMCWKKCGAVAAALDG